MITIELNGEPYKIGEQARLAELIERLNLNRGRIAVEINHAVVPKAEYGDRVLKPGDKVEIINFVGGG